jgi:hypothetical protein
MRRLLSIGLAVLVCSAGAAGAASPPTLRVIGSTPVKIVGAGFHATERVTVVVTTLDGRHSAHVTASPSGSFTATFPFRLSRCGAGYTVSARGEQGSAASLRVRPRACAQP